MLAEVAIGDCTVMMGEANERYPPVPMNTFACAEDVDATHRRAVAAGVTSTMGPADQFYGERTAGCRTAGGTPCGSRPTSRTCRRKRWRAG